MAEDVRTDRIAKLESRCAEQDQKISELQQKLSQMGTSPTSPQSAHGDYLLSKGWIPTENDLWELPARPQQVSEVKVLVPNIKEGKPGTEFMRKVVQAVPLPCSMAQAVFRQRKMDERDQKVA